MGSALLDNSAEAQQEATVASSLSRGGLTESASALRRQAAERLAAHRNRRMAATTVHIPSHSPSPRNARSARIAEAVAERYARTPSYRDFLAAEAERAVQQARAAAEVAALNAQAMAAAQQSLLSALENEQAAAEVSAEQASAACATIDRHDEAAFAAPLLWPELEGGPLCERETPRAFQPPSSRAKPTRSRYARSGAAEASEGTSDNGAPPLQMLAAGITVRLYQDGSGATRIPLGTATPCSASASFTGPRRNEGPLTEEEARLLEEEIAFRHEPVFEEPAGPPVPLPANLIEFPRQLVASRKARPRLAEGPLRNELEGAPGAGQLRIFEVEAEQIATAPEDDTATAADAVSAHWTAIWLDSQPHGERTRPDAAGEASTDSRAAAAHATRSLKDAASVQRRMLAASVNAAVLAAAFSGFAAISLWLAGHLAGYSMKAEAVALLNRSTLQAALPFAVCAFALLAAIYQALFFSFTTATPGMRAARIALCTFTDENPARAALRRRLLALLLSSAPMGLGFLWAALDEERLTWHDRICGIYQRSY